MASPTTSIPTITSISGTPVEPFLRPPLEPMTQSAEQSLTASPQNPISKINSPLGVPPSSHVPETPPRPSIRLLVPPQRLSEKSAPNSQTVKMTHEAMDQIKQTLQHYKTSLYYSVAHALEHPNSPQPSSASSVQTTSTTASAFSA